MEGNNTASKSTGPKSDRQHSNARECHICMQLPTDPVSTLCGHIFCWPCIYHWLRNEPQPCPICRTHLNKDRNILPLYGNNNGNGDGDGSAVETAAASDNADVLPPRPRNALMFGGGGARLEDSESRSESATHEAEEDDSQLSLKDLVNEILQERIALESSVSDSEQRNCDLRQEAQEREVRHLQETIKLVQHMGRLGRPLVRKDQMLSRANSLLPLGWSDGI